MTIDTERFEDQGDVSPAPGSNPGGFCLKMRRYYPLNEVFRVDAGGRAGGFQDAEAGQMIDAG
jgi:hypothetical protein